MIVGITGKSGCGKSTVSRYIDSLGYTVIDVDIIHKEISNKLMPQIYEIFERFGYGSLTHKEKVALFFKDAGIRNLVNQLTFAGTRDAILQECQQNKGKILVLDAPLLFSMKLDNVCDVIWYVYCDKKENIKRLMKRNNVSYNEALERYNALNFSQFPDSTFDLKIDTKLGYKRKVKAKLISYSRVVK